MGKSKEKLTGVLEFPAELELEWLECPVEEMPAVLVRRRRFACADA